jgi:hypothetical protein
MVELLFPSLLLPLLHPLPLFVFSKTIAEPNPPRVKAPKPTVYAPCCCLGDSVYGPVVVLIGPLYFPKIPCSACYSFEARQRQWPAVSSAPYS